MLKSYVPGTGFIAEYQRLVKNTIIPYQYEVLHDRAQGAAKSHVVANFVNAGDVIVIKLCDKPYFVYASNKVPQLTGQAAMCCGPLVYCFEGKDNEDDGT